ncbi:hypothetical protein CULCOIPH002_03630 [Corynebacterium ulcerans]|nr:hypothetical protein CULCOIPH001_17060 [Corynebacterium ulcerans]GJJ35451.1 hypothetical protein CULCOIPH002_03630 [Corynebacterium ulcerans]GJJ38113.1 hypothetical protein CULCOIPH003_07440 [Corynebacterium ulcerans]GJJ41117.1 hypothetical protein CULCOIPH004_15280 [Corynebacterium ulcerans]
MEPEKDEDLVVAWGVAAMNRFLLGGRCKKAATVVVKNVQLDTLDGFLKKVLMAHKPARHCEEEKL